MIRELSQSHHKVERNTMYFEKFLKLVSFAMILVQSSKGQSDLESDCYRRTLRTKMDENLKSFYRQIHYKEYLRVENYNEYLEKCKQFSSEFNSNLTEYIEHFGKCEKNFPIQHTIRLAKKAKVIVELFCTFDDEYRKGKVLMGKMEGNFKSSSRAF